MERSRIERDVLGIVRKLGGELGVPPQAVSPMASLVNDIGLDSLRFVDLTLELEDTLGIAAFPMQDWVDAQLERDHLQRFLIGDLVDECVRLIARKGKKLDAG